MEKQLIISIGREFGSAGHEIAERLSKVYQLPLYDHNLLREVAKERNMNHEMLAEFDEMKRNKLLTRTVNGMTSSPAHHVANMQFDFLRGKAEKGESFVVVGRCSNDVLREFPGFVSIFVIGDMDSKVERISKLYSVSDAAALKLIKDRDRSRKKYHNSNSKLKWGDSRSYDLTLNSSKLGLEESVRILKDYIDTRMNLNK